MKASEKRYRPVPDAYFKVLRKNIRPILIYFFVFLLITILGTRMGAGASGGNGFTLSRVGTAFVGGDGSPLAEGLKQYLSGSADFVPVKTDTQSLQDALFFDQVDYILRIPKGFSQGFMAGREETLERTAAQKSAGGVYMDLAVDRYLNTARMFRAANPELSQAQLAAAAAQNLSLHADVTFRGSASQSTALGNTAFYFTYLVYAFLSILFLVISSLMLTFNKPDLRRRNLSSPLPPAALQFQLFGGHLVLTLLVWLAAILLGAALFGGQSGIGPQFLLFSLNALCFALSALSISFLLGDTVRNRGAQNGMANVISLGLCFISGVFVPQQYLADSVLAAARFTPSYWYIRAVNDIRGLPAFTFPALRPVLVCMLIQLGFTAAFFAAALAFSKRRAA